MDREARTSDIGSATVRADTAAAAGTNVGAQISTVIVMALAGGMSAVYLAERTVQRVTTWPTFGSAHTYTAGVEAALYGIGAVIAGWYFLTALLAGVVLTGRVDYRAAWRWAAPFTRRWLRTLAVTTAATGLTLASATAAEVGVFPGDLDTSGSTGEQMYEYLDSVLPPIDDAPSPTPSPTPPADPNPTPSPTPTPSP
ncbi:MAG: hypothetical protein Q4B12_09590, partial [Bowdeniella nasicola]|nr:hypothetical protein [Bowdeniella nasicola]